jgi:uncharacterized membrane protein YwaF
LDFWEPRDDKTGCKTCCKVCFLIWHGIVLFSAIVVFLVFRKEMSALLTISRLNVAAYGCLIEDICLGTTAFFGLIALCRCHSRIVRFPF